MQFAANERSLTRLHLLGTLGIVLLLTLALGGFFSWRSAQDHQASMARVAQAVTANQQARLQAELDSAINFIEFTRGRTEDVLKKSLREQVDTAMQVALAIYQRESPHRSANEVKRLIIEALRPVRFFEGRGYFFIDDMQGQFILLPTAPQFEGKTMLENRDDTGHYIMRGLIDAARLPDGQGFSRYRWYAPDTPKLMADKLAYVRRFAPYDWLIGTGDYTQPWENLQKQTVLERLLAVRFGSSGAITVVDRDGHLLLSRAKPELQGKQIKELPKSESAALEQLLAKARSGGGFVQYQRTDANGVPVARVAQVRAVEPWGWTVMATVDQDELDVTLQGELARQGMGNQARWLTLVIPVLLALGLGSLASYAFLRWLSQLFAKYHEDIRLKNQAIADSAALFQAVFDNAAVGIAQVSIKGRFLQINQSFCDLLGYSHDEILAQGFTFQRITFPEDLDTDLLQADRLLAGEAERYTLEKRFICKDGSIVWVNLAAHLVRSAAGVPLYFISAVQDITERKRAEEGLVLAASVFTHAREGIMITEPGGSIINVNDAFTRITGYGRAEALGRNPRFLSSGQQPPEYYAAMWRSILEDGHWYGEIWNRRKNGEVFAGMQTISAVRNAQGGVAHFVSLLSDITTIKQHEQQLERIAHFDALTNLPNRVLLADRLQHAMLQAQRRGQLLAVVYLDMDGFKAINDRYGHDAGDRVLMGVASRMKDALREGDTLARLGGDEFVVVLVDLNATSAALPLLNRLLSAAAEPMLVAGNSLAVSVSLGVTYFPQADDMDADQLLRQADQAMYQAKLLGKNRYHLFDAVQDRSLREHHESLEHIRRALAGGELVLHYQPKVNMRSGRVIGAEALIRWQHPTRGLLAPAEFLPAIENHALAVEVGEWVIDTALRQMEAWHAQGLVLPVSVNVGARQLQQPDFVSRLQALLDGHPGIRPSYLELEVLETSALEDIVGVSGVIESCRAIGVKFALDDFGTGYSSLTYLKRLPVAQLKIDRSFVRDMLDDPDDMAILKGVIGLAQAFRREVIAEGVETVAHGTALLALGCDLAQGFGIARPMPAADVVAWAAQWQPDAAWR